MITFAQAREAAAARGAALFKEEELEGTYYVAPYGYEDAEAYAIIDGAREWLVDGDDRYLPLDRTVLFVLKDSGEVVEVPGLQARDKLAGMRPVNASG